MDLQQDDSQGNPVLSYLQHHGTPQGLTTPLANGYTLNAPDVDRSGYCVGTDAAILAYYLRILNTKCTLLIKLQPMFNISLES